MDKSPAFQFYVADWLDKRVLRMSLAAQGAYIRLLVHMWKDSENQCSIESDANSIANLLGNSVSSTQELLAELQRSDDPIFLEKDGRFISKRLRREKRDQQKRRKSKSEAGKLGMSLRYQKANRTLTEAITKVNSSSSSSSSSSLKDKEVDKLKTQKQEKSVPGIIACPKCGSMHQKGAECFKYTQPRPTK